jgi:hypothetical protein
MGLLDRAFSNRVIPAELDDGIKIRVQ